MARRINAKHDQKATTGPPFQITPPPYPESSPTPNTNPAASPPALGAVTSAPRNVFNCASVTVGSLPRSASRAATQTPTTRAFDSTGEPANRGCTFNEIVHPSLGGVANPVIACAAGLNKSTVGNEAHVTGPPLNVSASASGLSVLPSTRSRARPIVSSLRTSLAAIGWPSADCNCSITPSSTIVELVT